MNRIWKTALALGIGVFLSALPVSVMNVAAAGSTGVQEEEITYTVTYRPGKIGDFTGFAERCSAYGTVSVSERTGSVKVVIPAGGAYPDFPGAEDIQIKEEYQGQYMVNPDYDPTRGISTVTENGDYVVDYVAVVDTVEYSVRFVDAQSGEDIAVPVISQGNVNEPAGYPEIREIGSYRLTEAPGSILLTADPAQNILTFKYVDTREPEVNTVTRPGNTVVQEVPGSVTTVEVSGSGTTTQTTGGQETARTPESGTANGNNNETNPPEEDGSNETRQESQDTEASQDTEVSQIQVIPDEDVPLGEKPDEGITESKSENKNTENKAAENETTKIEDEEVPLAESAVQDKGPGRIWVYGGIGAAAAALIGAGAFFLKRRWK